MIAQKQSHKTFQELLMEANQAFNKILSKSIYQQMEQKITQKSTKQLITQQNLNQVDFQQISIIEYLIQPIQPGLYDQRLMQEAQKLKVRHISMERKIKLFTGFFEQQKKQIQNKKKKIQPKINLVPQTFRGKDQVKIQIQGHHFPQIFPINSQDFDKLSPNFDINDTIIENYFKILKFFHIPEQIMKKTYFFTTQFMGKLMGDLLSKEENQSHKELEKRAFEQTKKKIKQNYLSVKKWYRKINFFQFHYLVVPVNSNGHWNCIIIVHPNYLLGNQQGSCRIIGMDSMFEIKSMFYDSLKVFLEIEMLQKNGRQIECQNILSYQIIVPRQTNHHDCGLYVMCYIQRLFLNFQNISKLQDMRKKNYLQLFPQEIVFSMRVELKNLLYSIFKFQKNEQKLHVIQQYLKQRNKLFQSFKEEDYDRIDEKNFQKYCKLYPNYMEEKESKNESKLMLKFYLDQQINYYQQSDSS